ncbi:MAG: NAD-dependent epimerase/dehydratase family protein [Candidatus Gastranaerophilaceae bacterium]
MTANILETEYQKIITILDKSLEKLNGKSILITGANGLIGSYIVDFLCNVNEAKNLNITIYAMSRSKQKLEKRFGQNREGLTLVEQDLNNPLKDHFRYDYIIHAASNAHPLAYSKDPVGTMKTNLFGTMNLLETAKEYGAKFLYISTGEIYGNNKDRAFVETDLGVVDTKLARSCYPESKRAAETLCMAYNSQFGIDVNIARLCYVYGPTITDDNSRADAQFLRNALNGEDIVMKSEGLQRRTYCYVADAVSAILTILLKGESSEVYNVANSNSIVSIKEYAQTLCEIAGVKLKFELPDAIEAKGYSKPADSILESTKLEKLGWQAFYDIKIGLLNTVLIKRSPK